MKTDIDIKDDVYNCIKESGIMESVSGALRKTKRPNKSKSEDVVISILSNRQGQKQEAYVNVNVYVSDVFRDDQYEENQQRLKVLCSLFASVLESINRNGYWITLDEQRVMEIESTHEHMINNKLLYKVINE